MTSISSLGPQHDSRHGRRIRPRNMTFARRLPGQRALFNLNNINNEMRIDQNTISNSIANIDNVMNNIDTDLYDANV